MPKLTAQEYQQLHEIATADATLIAKATGFLSFVQDSDLKSMVENERRKAEMHYNELIDIANGESLNQKFEQLDGGLKGRPRNASMQSPTPIQPKSGQGFTDRIIAADLLDYSKSMTVRCIWAATEITHVGIRRALSEMARYHLDAAYEFFKFMEQKGWYVPLGANENAEQWFRQNHEQIISAHMSGRQESDWVSANAPMPS
ncbi:MAG: spore coat protein [Sulfobacillus acidophilus]|uniref:Spore coat protein n=1 Tax=Sulfobacillus acidophilus TaxID=53633 RepID=A0A2T2WC81_9FIRM|nr:MAG: spore coat protein [Sulfobacillus acidophilus]